MQDHVEIVGLGNVEPSQDARHEYYYDDESEIDDLVTVVHEPGDLSDEAAIYHTTRLVFLCVIQTIRKSAFDSCRYLQQVSFYEGLHTISADSFKDCQSLETVEFPSSLKVIHSRAFSGCKVLDPVSFNQGLLGIGNQSFQDCISLNQILCPSSLIRIGDSAFQHCDMLKSIELNDGLRYIGSCAFALCRLLTVVHIPNSIQTIRNSLFASCRSLLSVELPAGLDEIEGPFGTCENLVNVAPLSVLELTNTFDQCERLREVFFPEPDQDEFGDPLWNHDALINRFEHCPVHRICAKQSYLTTGSALEEIKAVLAEEPNAVERVDAFDMTPFHLLALSSKPRICLFQTLQTVCSRECMERADRVGRRPIHYLCRNTSIPVSDKRLLVEYLAQLTIFARADELGLRQWRLSVITKVEEILLQTEIGLSWGGFFKFVAAYDLLERYEFKEKLSLLELKVWHLKLKAQNQLGATFSPSEKCEKQKLDHRHITRVNCGAETIISNVLPFLHQEPTTQSEY
mmetsp:Transcript_11592/g.27891  ORF Transcript_11592/g.27891 Transcript_11592/m.27891 type:complete len:515 (+) Transcript_11592:44-1588(+)